MVMFWLTAVWARGSHTHRVRIGLVRYVWFYGDQICCEESVAWRAAESGSFEKWLIGFGPSRCSGRKCSVTSFIVWGRRRTPQVGPVLSAPCGLVQEVWWSPISFGSSDVRRRHVPAWHRGWGPAYLDGLIADQGQALPSSPPTLFGGYECEQHNVVRTVSLLAGKYIRHRQFQISDCHMPDRKTRQFVVNW